MVSFVWETGHETARIPCVNFTRMNEDLAMPVYKTPLSRTRSINQVIIVKIITGYPSLLSQRLFPKNRSIWLGKENWMRRMITYKQNKWRRYTCILSMTNFEFSSVPWLKIGIPMHRRIFSRHFLKRILPIPTTFYKIL